MEVELKQEMPGEDQPDDGSGPTIRTKRLILHLADPWSPSDCQEIIHIYSDPHAAKNAVSGIKTVADVQEKFKRHGPKPELCTLAPAPRGMYFLIYLSSDATGDEHGSNSKGVLIGDIILSFRPEMPYPDFGFALLAPYEGCGYATEAGQAVLRFWRDTVGVKEIFVGTAPDNVRSQKLAERLGFVRAGTFDVVFGYPPNERKETGGLAFVLPGMEWIEGKTMMLTVRTEVEDPEQYADHVCP